MHESPLHWAAKRGYERIVNILIKYEADILAKDLVRLHYISNFNSFKGWKDC